MRTIGEVLRIQNAQLEHLTTPALRAEALMIQLKNSNANGSIATELASGYIEAVAENIPIGRTSVGSDYDICIYMLEKFSGAESYELNYVAIGKSDFGQQEFEQLRERLENIVHPNSDESLFF
jgi:hypothetical protein